MAPELCNGNVDKVEPAVDMFSAGVVLAELFDGSEVSDAIQAFLSSLQSADPTQRPTALEALRHEAFQVELVKEASCVICLDVYPVSGGVTCTDGHFACIECLSESVRAAIEAHSHVKVLRDGSVCCVAPDCELLVSGRAIASAVPDGNLSALLAIVRAQFERDAAAEQERQFRDRVDAALREHELDQTTQNHIRTIQNEVLAMSCPRCSTVFADFDGCCALKCGASVRLIEEALADGSEVELEKLRKEFDPENVLDSFQKLCRALISEEPTLDLPADDVITPERVRETVQKAHNALKAWMEQADARPAYERTIAAMDSLEEVASSKGISSIFTTFLMHPKKRRELEPSIRAIEDAPTEELNVLCAADADAAQDSVLEAVKLAWVSLTAFYERFLAFSIMRLKSAAMELGQLLSRLKPGLSVYKLDSELRRKRARLQRHAEEHAPELLCDRTWLESIDVTDPATQKVSELGLLLSNAMRKDFQELADLASSPGKSVLQVRDSDGRVYVLKSFHLAREEWSSRFHRQVTALAQLQSAYIVRIQGVFMHDAHRGCTLMPFYEGGNLATWIVNNPHADLATRRRIAIGLLSGLHDLHSRGFVHCDVKPENVFLAKGLSPVLRDFDGVQSHNVTMAQPLQATIKYMAPELRHRNVDKVESAVDMFSVGVVLAELFEDTEVSDATESLVSSLLSADPSQRPTALAALRHEAFQVEAVKSTPATPRRKPKVVDDEAVAAQLAGWLADCLAKVIQTLPSSVVDHMQTETEPRVLDDVSLLIIHDHDPHDKIMAGHLLIAPHRINASDTANSSQFLSRSRQGLATQSGVQAPLDLAPVNVVRWSDFYTEVGWDSFSGAVGFGDVQVMARDFRTRTSTESIVNEVTAFLRFSGSFIDPLKEIVLDKEADTAINSFTPMDITQEFELASIGHRVDLAWTRKVNSDDDRNNAGVLTPDDESRARFLVHEHKSPGKFPYGLAADDFDNIAKAFMQNTSSSLDEAKETVNGAWELACDDMVDYWDLGASLTEQEAVMRFRYPIIQLYVTMLRSFCKYGVLSTTDRTWFFKVDENNVLHVSDVFHSTGTGRESMRCAYACMLHRAATGSARLKLTDDQSQAIAQTHIKIGSPEWTKIWRQFGWDGNGTWATASGGHHAAALPADMEALRETLPLKSDLHFPYAGGLADVITRYPEGRYSFSIRVDTGGVDTVVKVMTPSRDPHVESVFWHEMDVYLALRSLWGTYVPWYLYGGRHIFNDLIIATIYAGESLDANAINDDVREKAWEALMALHEVGVAHRNVQLQNFIMDDTGAVRIIDFAYAEMYASRRTYLKDCEAFDRIFFRSDT
ncbi:Protein kinase, putative [Hondaea fermentalgiana]|uniref:non-specific serine/threonine protein kinase n=1 Tax=Hondaea fermentalgiana TaxID=2315210 RepID=A0A2R5GFK0_9STRA|nr:Protein kinase, putative [Hondaea fermentalgiana]|eukprot:GBG28538.1 Protein kinase, putative [Hondaea fermentalgiana]